MRRSRTAARRARSRTALRNLAAVPAVDVAVVCRGGGSLTDLWAFCDETLCRTVALLRLPVISAVGHDSDRTLIDDVSAVCCSTPTHAADALVPVDLNAARDDLRAFARPRRPLDLDRDPCRADGDWRSWPAGRSAASASSAGGCISFSARHARRRSGGIPRALHSQRAMLWS